MKYVPFCYSKLRRLGPAGTKEEARKRAEKHASESNHAIGIIPIKDKYASKTARELLQIVAKDAIIMISGGIP